MAASIKAFGRIDVLVNNAGTLVERRGMEMMDEQLWDRVMNVNLKSAFLCSTAVIPFMKENKSGRIINMTSVAARNGWRVWRCALFDSQSGSVDTYQESR
jgi:3-oxoacyl-[acyl-carrier protein] reductase